MHTAHGSQNIYKQALSVDEHAMVKNTFVQSEEKRQVTLNKISSQELLAW